MNQKDVDEIKKKLPKVGDRVRNSSSGRIIFDSETMVEYTSSIDLTDYRNYESTPFLISKPLHIKVRIIFRHKSDKYKTVNIKLSTDHEVNQFIDNLTVFKRINL